MLAGAVCMLDSSKSGLKIIVELKTKLSAHPYGGVKNNQSVCLGKVLWIIKMGLCGVFFFLDMDFAQMLKS